jgi:hypothetical protein
MYLATLEDETGMWMDDPIACDTRIEAEECARLKYAWACEKTAYAMVLYSCQEIGEIERPQPAGT